MRFKSAKQNKLLITVPKHLFWFMREGANLDLNEPSTLDMYIKQVITRGRAEDVRALLKTVDATMLKKALKRINRFIPSEVRQFWEDFLGSHQ